MNPFEDTVLYELMRKFGFEFSGEYDFSSFRKKYGEEYIKIIDKFVKATMPKLFDDEDVCFAVNAFLTSRERLSIMLSLCFDLRTDEIAYIFGTTNDTVRVYRYRGMKKLRNYMYIVERTH